jgi:hypothetical protein
MIGSNICRKGDSTPNQFHSRSSTRNGNEQEKGSGLRHGQLLDVSPNVGSWILSGSNVRVYCKSVGFDLSLP